MQEDGGSSRQDERRPHGWRFCAYVFSTALVVDIALRIVNLWTAGTHVDKWAKEASRGLGQAGTWQVGVAITLAGGIMLAVRKWGAKPVRNSHAGEIGLHVLRGGGVVLVMIGALMISLSQTQPFKHFVATVTPPSISNERAQPPDPTPKPSPEKLSSPPQTKKANGSDAGTAIQTEPLAEQARKEEPRAKVAQKSPCGCGVKTYRLGYTTTKEPQRSETEETEETEDEPESTEADEASSSEESAESSSSATVEASAKTEVNIQ